MPTPRTALPLLFALWIAGPVLAMESPASSRRLNIGPAYSGSSINVVANRRHALFTHERTQFAAYYDEDGHVVIAHRMLGTDRWTTRRSDLKGNVKDAHNSISVAVDGAGFLHLAWDHHDSPLNYARGVRPLDAELKVVSRMTGSAEQRVTYPEFYSLPDGDLLYAYRDGQSGGGRLILNRYSLQGRAWTTLQSNLIDGEGMRSPYWSLAVDREGGVHLAWTWRDTPDVASNHDLAYAFSPDGGLTWRTIDGTSLSVPLTVANAAYAARIPTHRNLMNPPWVTTDADGRPYIVDYWSDAEKSPAQFRVVHHTNGKWETETITRRTQTFDLAGSGTRRPPISRGVLLVNAEGQNPSMHLIYRDDARGGRALLLSTQRLGTGPWRERELTTESLGAWEPTIDPTQWQRFQEIHLLIQRVEQGDGNDSDGVASSASEIGSLIVPTKARATAKK